ncbi:DUF397 domain-containing protein [Streptomyces sp. NPDC050674]|uniref:DUF397 domain-containing protein n=1 Tax=Streptomyces sp. NPDC050674 TaxID=3157216 RepID=UPI003427681C
MSAGSQIASEPRWFKSSYSGANTTECLECAYVVSGTLIRDSKRSSGPVVSVGSGAWRCFIGAISAHDHERRLGESSARPYSTH